MGCQASIESYNVTNTPIQNQKDSFEKSKNKSGGLQAKSKFSIQISLVKHLEQSEDYASALEAYLRLNEKYANKIQIYEGLVTCYRFLKNYDQAIYWDLQSLKLQTNNQNIYNSLSISYRLQKDYQNAEKYALKAIEINPKYSNAYYNLGNVYALICQNQKAIESYEKAVNLNPKATIYYKKLAQLQDRQYNFEKAINWYQKNLQINQGDAACYFSIGVLYKNKIRNKEKALEYLMKCIEIDPSNALAYNIIGNMYLSDEKLEESIQYFTKSIQIKRDYSYPYNGLGNAYYRQKKYPQAIQCYKKSISCDEAYATPYSGLGDCYKELNDLQNALKSYQKAIQLNPKDSNPYNGVGNVYRAYGNILESIKWFEKSIQINPMNEHPYNGLGNAYKDIKQYELALKNYGKVIQLNSNNIFAYNGIGNLFKQLKDYDQAETWYRKCMQIDAQYDRPYTNLGNQYLTQGKYSEALALFATAIAINPESDATYNSLGLNYSKLGDHVRSIEMFRKAIERNPTYSLAYINLSFEYIDFHNYQQAFKCLKKAKQIVDTSDRDVFSNCNRFILDQLQLFQSEVDEWQIKIKLGYLTEEDKLKIQMLRSDFENRFQSIFNTTDDGRLSIKPTDMNPEFLNLLKLIKKDTFQLREYVKLSKSIFELFKQSEDNFNILVYLFCKFFWTKRQREQLTFSQIDAEIQKKLAILCQVHPPISNMESICDEINLISISENEKVNLFREVEYFQDYRYLVKEIQEINKKCSEVLPIFKEFVYKISSENGGYHAKVNLKLPQKETQKFKVYIRIMEKMFKEIGNRKEAIILQVEAQLKKVKKVNMQSIMSCLLETWMKQINGILKQRKKGKIPTRCYISDFVRGKAMFKNVKTIEQAANKLLVQSELSGYKIVEIDNRLGKNTKDLVFKIKINQMICEFQMAVEFDDTQYHYNHCLYEIKRSPTGCIFGSFLFLSKSEALHFIKQAKEIKYYYEDMRLSKDEKYIKQAAEYLLKAFEQHS